MSIIVWVIAGLLFWILVPRLYFYAFNGSSIKISVQVALAVVSWFIWHLWVGQHVIALFKEQSSYSDTANFLNFMSCRRCSNKNICMYIKARASSKISPLYYISAPTKADFYTVGLKLKWTACCGAEVSGGYSTLISLVHNASKQVPTSKSSSWMHIIKSF